MTTKKFAQAILRIIAGIYAVGAMVALMPVTLWVERWLRQQDGGVSGFGVDMTGMMIVGMPALFFFMSSIYALQFALHGSVHDLNEWAEDRYRKG